jgi:RNA polymerase sigma-70 factor, ECF subfamily
MWLEKAVFEKEVIPLYPNLKAFAISLCGDSAKAGDLVQETLTKAWEHRASFIEGTNLKAWLFTILRNTYLSERRRRRYEVEDPDGVLAIAKPVEPRQFWRLYLKQVFKVLLTMSAEQRHALTLIQVDGLSYEEAARIQRVEVGTVKSRVNRARSVLCQMLPEEIPSDTSSSTEKTTIKESAPAEDDEAGNLDSYGGLE